VHQLQSLKAFALTLLGFPGKTLQRFQTPLASFRCVVVLVGLNTVHLLPDVVLVRRLVPLSMDRSTGTLFFCF
jgi:hypothetical protein